jgi:hypothetical protein
MKYGPMNKSRENVIGANTNRLYLTNYLEG